MPERMQSSEPDDRRSLTPDVPQAAFDSPGEPAAADLLERPDPRTIALVGLFVLAVAYTLFFARSFLLPVAVAVFLDFLLSPVVRWLRKLRVIV